ncbi:protein CFAP20DC isoform X2 [Hyperolius riggenbachi]
MFKNEYQGGAFVEIFSAQGKDPVAKWKLSGSPSAIWKDFDKEVKSFVFVLEGSSQTIKMQLPKDGKQMLGLIQRFLILQLYIPLGQDFSAELLITDLANIKRRLYLSTVHKELSATPLHAKIPLAVIRRKVWCNLCIDLVDFTSGIFKGAVFQSLDGIIVSANCKLRKIYTMKIKPQETEQDICGQVENCDPTDTIPRSCHISTDVEQVTQVLELRKIRHTEAREDARQGIPGEGDICGQVENCDPTDTIPRSCHISTDVEQVTQVLELRKIRHTEAREDARQGIPGEGDSLSSRGQGSSRDIRKGDRSHIAFGSKVSGPPPSSGRKNSARSLTESTRSTSRQEKSILLSSPEKGMGILTQATESRILSPKLNTIDQKNKEVMQQPQRKDVQQQDYHPHPPQEPPKQMSARLRSVGRKQQTQTVSDSSSVGHCGNEDKLSVQIHMSPCKNRAQMLGIASASPTDEWMFPDTSQDEESKLSDAQHQTDFSHNCQQLAGRSQTESSDPEDRPLEDLNETSPSSSITHSASQEKLRGLKVSKHVISLSLLEHDAGRGAQMEDDFYGSDSSIEEDDFIQWTSSPKSDQNPTDYSHPVDVIRQSLEDPSHLRSSIKTPTSNDCSTDSNIGGFSSQRQLMPTRSVSPSGSKNEASKGNSVLSKIQQFVTDNKLRTSMSRKSLKEIPKEDRRTGDEASVYDWRNYQMNRLSTSEMQMLASLKRQQNEELEDEGMSHGLSQSQIDHCNVSMSTSSDDTTTWTSCLPPPVNQGSHYQTEMNPLAQSNPRDWLKAFSPPIIPTSQNLDPLLRLKQSTLSSCNEGDDGIGADEEEDILTLLYDPCLNCYFDPETGKYYELA